MRIVSWRDTSPRIDGITEIETSEQSYRAGPTEAKTSSMLGHDVRTAGGKIRYMHIKDLQVRAHTEAKDLGPHIPVGVRDIAWSSNLY